MIEEGTFFKALLEGLLEFLVNAAKASVGHDNDHIVGSGFCIDIGDDLIDFGEGDGACSSVFEVFDDLFNVKAFFGGGFIIKVRPTKEGNIAGIEATGEVILEDIAAGGIAAGFKDSPDAAFGEAFADGLCGDADGGGVVSKVIDEEEVADLGDDLLSATDAAKAGESFLDLVCGDPEIERNADGSDSIGNVEASEERQEEGRDLALVIAEGEAHACFGDLDLFGEEIGLGLCAVGAEGGLRFFGDFESERVIFANEELSIFGDAVHEQAKGGFDGIDIFVNIGVIEFNGGKDHAFWVVVDEFGYFVEESGVVFIAFDYKVLGLGKSIRAVEIGADAADEDAGLALGVVEQPACERCGSGLAVRSCDDDDIALCEKEIVDSAWHGGARDALLHGGLDFGIGGTAGIANDHKIGAGLEVAGLKTGEGFDLPCGKLIAHGRIDRQIGACDLITRFFEHPCQRPHARPADADEMDVANL